MRKFAVFLILLFAASFARAQQAGQLYITSYNDTVDIGYICNGVGQNVTFIGWAGINLDPSVPITIDSFTFLVKPPADAVNFQYLQTQPVPIKVTTGAFYSSGPNWAATTLGTDTLQVIGHYSGQFTDTANLIFHAEVSPMLAMYGYTLNNIDLGGGYGIGGIQQAEETDTMHDDLTTGFVYHIGDSPYMDGGVLNGNGIPVELRSCGGATIDSIYEVGDFSEFVFDSLPALPYTIPGDDSLVLNYEFTPRVVDETGSRHHYLVFHSTDGNYLVWSFEYKVFPASSVNIVPAPNRDIRIFPNPAANDLEIESRPSGTVRLFDVLGREVIDANDDGEGATLDVSRLQAGTYFLRLGTESAKVIVTH